MASISIRLFTTEKNKQGLHPLKVTASHNRKQARKTLIKLRASQWDGRAVVRHPDKIRLNQVISDELSIYQSRLKKLLASGDDFSPKEVFESTLDSGYLYDTIVAHSEKKTLTRPNQRKFVNLANKIREFKDMPLSKVDIDYVQEFAHYLRSQERINSENTVQRYLKFLKTVLRDQWRKGNYEDRVVTTMSTRETPGNKVKLTREEFKLLASCPIKELSRDCFALQVYLRGARVADALQLRKAFLREGRVQYYEQKTGKFQDVEIIEPAQEIIDRYREVDNPHVLPILQLSGDPKKDYSFQKHIHSRTAIINRDLKMIAAYCHIDKHITTHVARHTFANWADQTGMSSRDISKLLNHSSLKVTETYLDQLRRSDSLDQAARKVWDQ